MSSTVIIPYEFTATSGNVCKMTFMIKNRRIGVDANWTDPQTEADEKEVADFVQSVLPPESPAVDHRREQDGQKRTEVFRELFGLARHDRN